MIVTDIIEKKEKNAEIVTRVKDSIVLDYPSISSYGNEVSKKLSDFSSEILKSVQVKDSPEVEELLLTLVGQLNSIDCTTLVPKKQSFIRKLFGGQDLKTFITKYETVQQFITGVSKQLAQAEYSLSKDINTCNIYIKQNQQYINELDVYIEAGKQKLKEARDEYEARKITLDKSDILAGQELSLKESELNMFERKIHNLELQRMVAIQNIPQLMLIRDGDAVLVEKIQSSIDTSIPLWESQMVIAIQTMRQQNGAKLVKSITDTNNELLRRNSELLKTSTTSVAIELERDIVDLETLKETNNNLIATIEEIRSIRQNGIKNRASVVGELVDLQHRLIETSINDRM